MASEELPLITCGGNQSFISAVRPAVEESLSAGPVQWQRSYGRASKPVIIKASFVPFDVHQLPRSIGRRLLKYPVLHIYWIDCDSDVYKKKIRDEVFMWQSALKALSIPDWLIVVVTHDENKVKSKLLRTSVYDKVKSEFGSRQSNRCILFTEPFKNEVNSEVWQTVISRIQSLTLSGFSRVLSKFEDAMRAERERRTQSEWTFSQYFLLQEELAKFYYTIELYDDALVQYDELDALFAQFIVNHSVGDRVSWLLSYSQLSSGWEGVSMNQDTNMYRRMLILEDKPSLLDLRNYLFSRQSDLLFKLKQAGELTSRALKFIHNTMHELRLLEVSTPPGAMSCWVFLTCKEILAVCEPFKQSLGMEKYYTYTSALWTCMHSVIEKLGILCGLMPGCTPTSSELHSVVQLISGIGQLPSNEKSCSPQDKLRKILSSSKAFCEYYVELTEMTMGTLKYIGYARQAALLGQQLAKFYMASGQPRQAEPFLLNCIQMFGNEQWKSLETDTWRHLADCEKQLDNHAAHLKACLQIAASSLLEHSVREEYCNRILSLPEQDDGDLIVSQDAVIVHVLDLAVVHSSIRRSVDVNLFVNSCFPMNMECRSILLLVKSGSNLSVDKCASETRRDVLSLCEYTDSLDEEGEIAVGISCSNPHSLLTQKDSQARGHMLRHLSRSDVQPEEEQEIVLSLGQTVLQVGKNRLQETFQFTSHGKFKVDNMRITLMNGVEIFIPITCRGGMFTSCRIEPPSIHVVEKSSLYQGMVNRLTVYLSAAQEVSSAVNVDSKSVQVKVVEKELEDMNDNGYTYRIGMELTCCCDEVITPGCKVVQMETLCEGFDEPILTEVKCHCPIETQTKLHTVRNIKFIQLSVFLIVPELTLKVNKPTLNSDNDQITFTSLNPADKTWDLTNQSALAFVWRLDSCTSDLDDLRCQASLNFSQEKIEDMYTFQTELRLHVMKTAYTVTRCLKPGSIGSPVSNLSSLSQASFGWQALCECEMIIQLQTDLSCPEETDVSYEVISDPSWAISDQKTGSVVLEESGVASFSVHLMPLISGELLLPEVRLRNADNEDFLPGQVYDVNKLSTVYIKALEE